MDVTNPGLIEVENQTYGNPSLKVDSLAVPENSMVLVPVVTQVEESPDGDVPHTVFPSPAEEIVGNQPPPLYPQDFGLPVPDATEFNVAQQNLGQGVWLPIDPLDPGGEKRFVPPSEFIVAGPGPSIQTNFTEEEVREYTVTGVLDANTLLPPVPSFAFGTFTSVADAGGGFSTFTSPTPLPAGVVNGSIVIIYNSAADYNGAWVISNITANTFDLEITWAGDSTGDWMLFIMPVVPRYLLIVDPADLTSFPVSLLGREIVFGELIGLSEPNSGATRRITGIGANFVAIDSVDPTDSVPTLVTPQINDTFTLDVQRNGPEVVSFDMDPTEEVTIFPDPPAFIASPDQALLNQGNVEVSTGPQPGEPIITSGENVPASITVNVSDQVTTVGLPKNVFI